jgi:biotin carboxyl carrier protein
MKYQLSYLNKVYDVDMRQDKDEFIITIGQQVFRLKDCVLQGYQMACRIADKLVQLYFAQDKEKYHLVADGEYYVIQQAKASGSGFEGGGAAETNSIASSMPGLLVRMPVKVGDKVVSGDILAIVEAMKMQTELHTPRDGVVKKVNFKEGEQVDAFQPIVELEPQ